MSSSNGQTSAVTAAGGAEPPSEATAGTAETPAGAGPAGNGSGSAAVGNGRGAVFLPLAAPPARPAGAPQPGASSVKSAKAANSPAAMGSPGARISWPRPTRPRVTARSMYRLHRLLEPNRFYRWLARRVEGSPRLSRLFTAAEAQTKEPAFGCRMCGQCALPATGYTCPMGCPKELRNGPCGGVRADGGCEVHPELRCVWVTAYERAAAEGRAADLSRLQRPIDQRRWGQSSWVNYWQGRDEELWTGDDGLDTPPDIRPSVPATTPPAATADGAATATTARVP